MDKHTQAKKPPDDDGPDTERPESEPRRTVTADEDEDVFDEDEGFDDDDDADDDDEEDDNDIDDEPMPARPVK